MSGFVSPNNPVKRAIDQRAALIRDPRKRRRYTASAYETASVEAGFTNPSSGDADSEGWRQERKSIYKDPTNLPHSVDRYFNELAAADHGQPSYELSADVQRPAAQYRGRYKQAQANALKLLGSGGVPSSSSSITVTPTRTKTTTTQNFDQAGYDQAVRRQKVAALLQHAGRGSSVLFKSGLLSTAPIDPTQFQSTSTSTKTIPGQTIIDHAGGPSSSEVGAALAAAKKRLGVHEDNGTNRSASVDQLEKRFGMVGQPWCGIFLGTALKEAGVKGVDSRVASVAEIERMARNKDGAFAGGWHSGAHARVGDAVIPAAGQHVALVTRVDPDGTIHTIGGNQGTGAVTRGAYKASQVHGVARPSYR